MSTSWGKKHALPFFPKLRKGKGKKIASNCDYVRLSNLSDIMRDASSSSTKEMEGEKTIAKNTQSDKHHSLFFSPTTNRHSSTHTTTRTGRMWASTTLCVALLL